MIELKKVENKYGRIIAECHKDGEFKSAQSFNKGADEEIEKWFKKQQKRFE